MTSGDDPVNFGEGFEESSENSSIVFQRKPSGNKKHTTPREPIIYPEKLPGDCPVMPLGKQGSTCYFIDVMGELREILVTKLTRNEIYLLFGESGQEWLRRMYPPAKDGLDRFSPSRVSVALIAACTDAGIWSTSDKSRGRGSWKTEDGRLLMHLGNRLLVSHKEPSQKDGKSFYDELPPSVQSGLVYATAEALNPPGLDYHAQAQSDYVGELLAILSTWNFENGVRDARLLIGWLFTAFMGGALEWRSHLWIEGSLGTGKSTLFNNVIRPILGNWGIESVNTTMAGIQFLLANDSRPVVLDEQEAGDGSTRIGNIILLARYSSSGDVLIRGTPGQTARITRIFSSFLFGSINTPALEPADASRITKIRLNQLVDVVDDPYNDPEQSRLYGESLRAHALACWHGWPGLLSEVKDQLRLANPSQSERSLQQNGTLLAGYFCAHYGISPDFKSDSGLADVLRGSAEIIENNEADADSNARQCLDHLLKWHFFYGRDKYYLSQFIDKILGSLYCGHSTKTPDEGGPSLFLLAKRMMGHLPYLGLRMVQFKDVALVPGESGRYSVKLSGIFNREHPIFLVIPYNHSKVGEAFHGSRWESPSSASMGVWKSALERHPDIARVDKQTKIRFSGDAKPRAVLCIPLSLFTQEDSGIDHRRSALKIPSGGLPFLAGLAEGAKPAPPPSPLPADDLDTASEN